MPKTRKELTEEYGKEKVEWAEELVQSNDFRDEQDRHYP